MALELAVQIIFILCPLLLYSPMSAQQTSPCESKCGNVVIPFPFGMNSSPPCYNNSSYLNKWFEIECRNNQTPFLKSINLEVTEIDIGNNKITVMNPIYRCQSSTTSIQSTVPLNSSLFFYSETNRFIVFGCNTLTSFRSESPGKGDCLSYCESERDMLDDNGCFGQYCCQTTLPSYLSEFDISILRVNVTDKAYNTNQPCDFVLIVDPNWLSSKSWNDDNVRIVLDNIKNSSFVPVVLDWGIPIKATVISINPNPEYCTDYRTITSSGISFFGRSCHCPFGFKGNPYISGRCIGDDGGERNMHTLNSQMTGSIVVASLGSISLLIAAWWWLYKIIKKKRIKKLKEKYFQQNGGLLLQQKLSSSHEFNVDTIKLFSLKDLEKATDRFNVDRVLGKGGQGTVYKGMLADGKIVAVKKLKVQGNVEDFINEVVILAQINHRNVVKLLGCCLETKFPLLVYEFIPNGTLFDHLHEQNDEFPMTWDMRLRIAIEVSGAVFYLHSAASQPIYHRDIKSTNILLDEKYRAKVADFGASRMVSNIEATHVTTRVQGTFGYLDPEYYHTSQLTEKSDVYSFGVVLVELLTGQKAISSIGSDGYAKSLASSFITSMDENCLIDILDDEVLKEGDREHIMVIANLAKRSLNLNGKNRPTMREVTMELEGIQNLRKESNDHHDRNGINLVKTDTYTT